jgi:hypothetical protein
MGCSCSAPRPYQLTVAGEVRTVYGLDQIVFSTILAFPASDEETFEELWQNLCSFNPNIDPAEKNDYKPALLELYNNLKKKYEIFENEKQIFNNSL